MRNTTDLKALRAKALYDQDAGMKLRKSHQSPVIETLYKEFFDDGFGGHKAHHCLHTSYTARPKYK